LPEKNQGNEGVRGWANPPSKQQRTGDVAEAGDTEPGCKANAELQLPELIGEGGNRQPEAEQRQAQCIDDARPGEIEQAADERRGQSHRQRSQRIDRDNIGPRPPECFGNGQQKDGKGFAEATPDQREREAQREHQ